jgi:metal-responsive CopG/Arc/MetJ family transcriptional regulator
MSDAPSPTKPSVGRKPFAEEKMTVRFKAGAFARIDAVAGKNRRAEFIRDAVEKELVRREQPD